MMLITSLTTSFSKVEVLSLNLKGESVLDHKEFRLYPGCDDQGHTVRFSPTKKCRTLKYFLPQTELGKSPTCLLLIVFGLLKIS